MGGFLEGVLQEQRSIEEVLSECFGVRDRILFETFETALGSALWGWCFDLGYVWSSSCLCLKPFWGIIFDGIWRLGGDVVLLILNAFVD